MVGICRPQEDRHHVPGHGVHLLPAVGHPGAPHPPAAGGARATVVNPNMYNQLFTMHGTGMIFLFTIPCLVGGFANYFLPMQIGARDVAFPRLNALQPVAADLRRHL